MTHGRGIDVGTKLALNPEAVISIDSRVIGAPTGQPKLKDVLSQLTFVRSWEFTSASVVGDWEVFVINPSNCAKIATSELPYTGGIWQPTYMGYYGNFHAWWIGSINAMLTFHTSKNVSADFRLAHFPEIVSFGAPLEDYDGDIVSEVIAVHGKKEICRNFADISTQHYRPVDPVQSLTAAGSIGVMALALESAISTMGSAVDASIYVNLYVAAGGDFNFMKHRSDVLNPLIDPQASLLGVPEIKGESNLKDASSRPFPGIRQAFFNPEIGFINPDPTVFITDLVKRHSVTVGDPWTVGSEAVLSPSYNPTPPVVSSRFNTIGRLIAPFLFWRGSMRGAYWPPPTWSGVPAQVFITPGDGISGDQRRDPFRGGVVMNTNKLDPIFFELPWPLPRLFNEVIPTHTQSEPTYYAQVWDGDSMTSGDIPYYVYPAVGDDFSIGPLSSCPSIGYITPTLREKDIVPDDLDVSVSTREKLFNYLKGKEKKPDPKPSNVFSTSNSSNPKPPKGLF